MPTQQQEQPSPRSSTALRIAAAVCVVVMVGVTWFAPCDNGGFWTGFKLAGGIKCPVD